MIDNNRKPLFEYSDYELKALGFDLLDLIENYQKDLSMIRIEIERRKASNVLSSMVPSEVPKIFTPNGSKNDISCEMVSFDPEEYNGPYKRSEVIQHVEKPVEQEDLLITPIKK